MQITTFGSSDELASGAADFVAQQIGQIVGRPNIGLAGGSTPAATYQELRRRPLDWTQIDLWLSDERWVAHDSEESNGLMVRNTLVDHVDGANLILPPFTDTIEPRESAASYEASLRHLMPSGTADLILLGMGTDGHTASLFPNSQALIEAEPHRWYVSNWVDSQQTWRLTVTPGFLLAATNVAVIVSGEPKAEVLASVVNSPNGTYPLEMLHRAGGDVTFLIDEAAASQL